jgi:hypothetical protein
MSQTIINDYTRLTNAVTGSQPIRAHLPSPTQDDYDNGYVDRYFIQKTNDKESPIYEVNNKTFLSFTPKPGWIGVSVRWRLTGPSETIYNDNGEIEDISISESNRRVIELRKQKMPSLKKYLGNLTQFSQK